MTIRRHRSIGTVGGPGASLVAIAAVLALSACQSGTEEVEPTSTASSSAEDPMQTSEGPAAPSSSDESAATTDDVAATQAPADAAASSDAGTDDDEGEAAEVPEPGTEVSVGDTVTTHVQALEEGDEYYGFATVATTVTSVEKGDPELFTEAENAEDFKGYTPWYVYVDYEWLTYEGTPNANMVPHLVAFNSDGGEVSSVSNATWSEGIPDCTIDLPSEKQAGAEGKQCIVYAVPDSEGIGSVGWRGDDYADGDPADNPYYEDPVLWQVG